MNNRLKIMKKHLKESIELNQEEYVALCNVENSILKSLTIKWKFQKTMEKSINRWKMILANTNRELPVKNL